MTTREKMKVNLWQICFLFLLSSCVTKVENLQELLLRNSEELNTHVPPSTGTVLKTVMDFENTPLGNYYLDHLWYYGWGADGPQWRTYSTIDVKSSDNNKYVEMWISDQIPNAISHFNSPASQADLSSVIRGFSVTPYLHPETDALRVKIKVVRGQVGLSFGAPVSQVGNSDVLTAVKYVSVSNMDDCKAVGSGWFECDFDFNEKLIRNTRRGNFSLDDRGSAIKNEKGEEIIHFTRWIQEALSLYIIPYKSQNQLYLHGNPIVQFDDFQFINQGKGKPLAVFSGIKTTQVIDDFQTSIDNAFTVDFDFSAHQKAPVLSSVVSDDAKLKYLQIVSRTFEENAWTGIKASNGDGANGVSFLMKVTYAVKDNDTNHVIDFIALSNQYGEPFNWTGFADATGEYDYVLSRALISDKNIAIYHARRIIPRDVWVTVTIPFADFVAAYGSGQLSEDHTEQKPLLGSKISVVGLQTTFANVLGATTIQIDHIKFVTIPGTPQDLTTFWQAYQ